MWELAGLDALPKPLITTYTLGADTPEKMSAGARAFSAAKALKLKLTGEHEDAERIRAVRAARPDVWLGVDANQGFTPGSLGRLLATLVDTEVKLIEQPFPIGRESELEGLRLPIAVAADESVQGIADLPALVGRFNVVNIKLDKCGGLTEALVMARTARRLGLDVMVGNMGGTSLAMAPAFLVGQLCQVVDLDGPLIFSADRSPGVSYENGELVCGEEVWGRPEAALLLSPARRKIQLD
jgi:L-alanine-DL-glutamate epimerase-like enolase superfamily enzyme